MLTRRGGAFLPPRAGLELVFGSADMLELVARAMLRLLIGATLADVAAPNATRSSLLPATGTTPLARLAVRRGLGAPLVFTSPRVQGAVAPPMWAAAQEADWDSPAAEELIVLREQLEDARQQERSPAVGVGA